MITFYNPMHRGHAPAHEFFRGERVPCFESPARVDYVEEALRARGHAMVPPDIDSGPVLPQVHAPRYLAFLQTAWPQWLALDPANSEVQPFPSVWPVRTLRSDVEPENFIARLGLYSMDNGTPLAHGTWDAAKAGAEVAKDAAKAAGELGKDVAKATTEVAKDAAATAKDAAAAAKEVAGKTKDAAKEVAEKTKEVAKEVADKAKDAVKK